MSPQKARTLYDRVIEEYNFDLTKVSNVIDREISGPNGHIPLRIILPLGPTIGPLPIFIFFHGGGWVIGSVASREPQCREIANKANCIVVAVSYRLVPEHKFPATVDDAKTAVQWTIDHAVEIGGDPNRVAVGGDSAGANLATVVALQRRRYDGPNLCFQLLIYPTTDPLLTKKFPSYDLFEGGYFLTYRQMSWYRECYLPNDFDPSDIRLSPILAENFVGLPPTLIVTAECDPLRDDGANYAQLLRQSGVSVEYIFFEGMIHGFWHWGKLIESAGEALNVCISNLKRVFELESRVHHKNK